MTATALSSCTTWRTPGTLRAWVSSTFTTLPPITGLLQHHGLFQAGWHRQCRGCLDQFAIAELAAARRMQHETRVGMAGSGVDVPPRGSRIDEEHAAGRARTA